MADKDIKEFASGWIMLGVMMFCMLTFATIFMAQNNPIGLGEEAATQLGLTKDGVSSQIMRLPDDADALLNITANTNPTEGFLGSRDSVASSYGITDVASGFFTSSKTLISWVFTGLIGQMLLALFGGLFGLYSLYWVVKWVRTGT